MAHSPENFSICFAMSVDMNRRFVAQLQRQRIVPNSNPYNVFAISASEIRATVLSERPQLLFVDMPAHASQMDLLWLRATLRQIRERFEKQIMIALVVGSPQRFRYAGDLLFEEKDSLTHSGLLDTFLIAAPPGIPGVSSLEEQFLNTVEYASTMWQESAGADFQLPTMNHPDWLPSMCDPRTRETWLRWLPRYAGYVNENPLIVGPTGGGKTKLAAALHRLSKRPGPFVSITPRDFSSTELVQAELFGAVAGAYTGAVDKWGLVKKAEKGTLFIDELQSIDLELQGKLITFIENKTYRRVGEAQSHAADVRFVFATNRPLQDLIAAGMLRDDFAYRLERLELEIPALTERRLDIAAGICYSLAKVLRERRSDHTLGAFNAEATVDGLTMDAYAGLFAAPWPGNLRQVENVVAQLVEWSEVRGLSLVDAEAAHTVLQRSLGYVAPSSTTVIHDALEAISQRARNSGFPTLQHCIDDLSDECRRRALEQVGGDSEQAAQLLGESSRTLDLFAKTQRG